MAKKTNAPVTEHAIRQRSYLIWESEGYPEGKEKEHWFRAQAELLPAATKPEKTKKSAGTDITASKAQSSRPSKE